MKSRRREVLPIFMMCVGFATLSACGEEESRAASRESASSAAATEADQVESVIRRYVAIYTQLANSGEASAGAFDGVAEGDFAEKAMKVVQDQRAAGVVRKGSPTITDTTVTLNGNNATAQACYDESSWKFVKDGEQLDLPADYEPKFIAMEFRKVSGDWIMTDRTGTGQAC